MESMLTAPENEKQRRYWNENGGAAWTSLQDNLDRQLGPLGDAALAAARLQPGERVLDVGCGCGHTSLQASRMVSPGGRVVGVDISAPMIDRATERANAEGLDNVSFALGDAQVCSADLVGGVVDVVVSRFGVMFFADPVAAFANLAALTRSGGRIAFVCWQSDDKNGWSAPMRAELFTIFPDQPIPGPNDPGPFSLADPTRTRELLESGGWVDVCLNEHAQPIQVFGTTNFDQAVTGMLLIGGASRLLTDATDAQRGDTHAAARRVIQAMWTEHGAIADATCWIVTARRP